MNLTQLMPNLVLMAITLVIGIIGFFLKRTIGDVDRCEQHLQEIEKKYVPREELSGFRAELDKMEKDISGIKEDYITKEDFFREQAKTDRKLDRIMDILLEMKGGGKHG